MLMCLSDANQPTASLELKIVIKRQKLQIAYANEKLDIIKSQVNAS